MEALIKLDRDVAEMVFGPRPGRPTVSRRAGGVIGGALGIDVSAATTLFHLGLALGALVLIARKL